MTTSRCLGFGACPRSFAEMTVCEDVSSPQNIMLCTVQKTDSTACISFNRNYVLYSREVHHQLQSSPFVFLGMTMRFEEGRLTHIPIKSSAPVSPVSPYLRSPGQHAQIELNVCRRLWKTSLPARTKHAAQMPTRAVPPPMGLHPIPAARYGLPTIQPHSRRRAPPPHAQGGPGGLHPQGGSRQRRPTAPIARRPMPQGPPPPPPLSTFPLFLLSLLSYVALIVIAQRRTTGIMRSGACWEKFPRVLTALCLHFCLAGEANSGDVVNPS